MSYTPTSLSKSQWFTLPLIPILFVVTIVGASLFQVQPAAAQTVLPELRYASSSNTVYIGRPYDASIPAEAAYVGYPSHPNAPKISITIPQLATALSRYNLFVDQGNGIWLVKVNLVIYQNALLSITSPTIKEVRLESYLTATTTKKYTKVVANGGQLYIKGDANSKIKIQSWNTPANTVDTNYNYGRSYLAALYGARMDIIDAEAAYLGWYSPNPNFPGEKIGKGEPSGLAWRFWATPKSATSTDYLKTGATGSIVNSLIHHNYYGSYTYQASNMLLTGNQVYANIYYGFDPHDYSTGLVITNNELYNNGYHGLILSRGCTDNVISNNKMYNNTGHGFMLDRGSDNNQVSNNESYGNKQDGMAIYASIGNVFTNNISRNNGASGLRIHSTYDTGDIFDGLAIDNVFENNTFINNGKYGINLYERADRNTFTNNIVTGNAMYGIYLATGLNQFTGNTISSNTRNGINLIGTPAYALGPGQTPPVTPIGAPGAANRFNQNTVNSNKVNGIAVTKAAVNTTIMNNVIASNTENGVYVKDSTTIRNLISQNSITGNVKLGIALSSSGNASMPKPVIKKLANGVISGTAKANAKVEIYRDTGGEGKMYQGVTTANSSGAWSFTLPATDSAALGALTAIAIDSQNNTSPFASPFATAVAIAAEVTEPEVTDEVYATDAMFAAEVADNQAAAAADMQNPPDVDYSDTLRELEQLEAEAAQSTTIFLPFVTK